MFIRQSNIRMKKYSGVVTLSVAVGFDKPDGSDLTDDEVYAAFAERLNRLYHNGDLIEATTPIDDIQEEE